MARKIFYMVRHGESLLNAGHIRQGQEGGLSTEGVAQAVATGKRLSGHKFGAVLVSPYVRTRQTAENICAQIAKRVPKIEFLELLTERRNPTEIIRQSADDPKVRQIVDLIDKSFHKDDYRYSDEENFQDLEDRARALLVYLAHRPEKELLVVTHSIFLKMVASFLLYRDRLTADKYNLLSYANDSGNASVSIFEYDSGWLGDRWLGRKFYPIEKRWRIIAWDDFYADGTRVSD
jgi:broad specificity phosphatase PhoE